MNLESIKTVSDLVEQNKPLTHQELLNLVEDNLDYTDAVRLAKNLVTSLAVFHQQTRLDLIEKGDAQKAGCWAYDEGLLFSALMSLDNITID